MNETTKQALEAFLQRTVQTANAAADFTVEQTPLLVQEWLRWQIIDGIFVIFLWAIVVGAGWVTFNLVVKDVRADDARRTKEYGRQYNSEDGITFAKAVRLVVVSVLSVIVLGVNGWPILKVVVAPRVVIAEKLLELVK